MAKATAMASGVNRNLAAPVSSTTGMNTMQMDRVETKAGAATCWAESRMARTSGFFSAMLRWVFSISTVASSTRMPTASARPPSVMTLMVSPSAVRMTSEVAIDSGMDVQTIRVERQEPRNSRIIRPVSAAAMAASRATSEMESADKDGLVEEGLDPERGRQAGDDLGMAFLTPSTMSSVLVLPFLSTVSSAPFCPSVRTMLVCTA